MLEGLGGLDVKVVNKLPTDCDQVKGVDAAETILTANPDVDAIYGACGPPIIGALESIKNAGRTPDSIVVVGFDASPDEVAAIEAGTQDATVAQFPAKMGELGIDTVYKAVTGETVRAERRHGHGDRDQGERRGLQVGPTLRGYPSPPPRVPPTPRQRSWSPTVPITITEVVALDIRFPTSRSLDGSDAMNERPDYSAAYVILRTDDPGGLDRPRHDLHDRPRQRAVRRGHPGPRPDAGRADARVHHG